MKNLKINENWFMKTVSAVLVLTTLTSFTGCSIKKTDGKSETSKTLSTVVADNRMLLVSDLRLKNLETKEIIELDTIAGLVVGNKIDRNIDIVRIVFDSEVESILVGDEFIPVNNLGLFNSTLNQDIDSLDYVIIGDELIPISEYVYDNVSEEKEESEEEKEESEVEYKEITDEEFYNLVDEIYEEYSKIGLDVTREEVIDYIMFVNIDRIANDNKELITTIVGDRKIENVELNAFNVYSAVMTRNNENYCANGLGFDSLILVSDTVFDKEEKEVVLNIEERIQEIVETSDDKTEFNKLLNDLLMEMLSSTEEEFNMESGVGYSTMTILINFVRRNFTNTIDEVNAELIKYFISYAEEYGTSYYDNSRSTAYYSGLYNLLTDTMSCGRTRTR